MPKKASPIQLKNKAVCVVFSWMRAWNIDTRLPEKPGEGDLVVAGKRVALREDRQAGEHDLALAPSAILGSDLRATIAELHRLTDFLGRGKPAGFREVKGTGRASPSDYLGVSMRLTPFARTPNIPTEDIVRWHPTLKRESDRAARRCASILAHMGLDKHDLYNIGLVYLSNYLSRHQDLGNEKVNGANLSLSLVQQYGRWADVTVRHLRSVAPVTTGLPLDAIVGRPHPSARIDGYLPEHSGREEGEHVPDMVVSYTMDFEGEEQVEDSEPDFATPEEEEKYMRRKAMQDGRYQAKRRRNAIKALEDGLAMMPHDRMVSVLTEVWNSGFQHPDAREEARRRLDAHMETCTKCGATSTAPTAETRTPARSEAA